MFKKNTKHMQGSIFASAFMLSEEKRTKLAQSEEQAFYELIYRKINEEDFACLYSEKESRPNAPINAMVSSLILMNRKSWTYEQLFNEIDFNILTRTALGLHTLDETPFCAASIFNFQNKINDYFVKSGVNLFEKVFDHLTQAEIKTLKLRTNIQRTDSFSAASNIRNLSRLQLLVEILIRIYRVLDENDKLSVKDKFQEYTRHSASHYLYHLTKEDIPHKIEEIGQLYYWVSKNLVPKYKDVEIFKTFELVYQQHFTSVDEKVLVVSSDKLTSGMVQSPDDLEATYHKKSTRESKGQTISIVETAHPDNELNLITDVAIAKNNVDDSVILNSRLATLKEKTPDLEQLHMDGAYGSKANDEQMNRFNIMPVQTAIKGAEQRVPISIEKIDDTTYKVQCPLQSALSVMSGVQHHKAAFDARLCAGCPQSKQCSALNRSNTRVYYFSDADYLRKRRHKNINTIPQLYRTIRSNVEATICEFSNKLKKRKLKVRGFFKTSVFAYAMAVSINFGRIYRHVARNGFHSGCATPVFSFHGSANRFFALFSFFKDLCRAFFNTGSIFYAASNLGAF